MSLDEFLLARMAEFLRARIAEDEQEWQTWSDALPDIPFLTECEAKRQIVALAENHTDSVDAPLFVAVLRILALAYSDHPELPVNGEVAQRGMHGYCGSYWVGPVVVEDGSSKDVCTGCGSERAHVRKMASRRAYR